MATQALETPTTIPKPTTPIQPTATLALIPTPTPIGEWERRIDDLSGASYLAPPPGIEAEIREAFDAVMAVEVITDRSDAEALAYDREAALEKMEALTEPYIAEYFAQQRASILLGELGPENPVTCGNFHRCTVGREHTYARTAIVYDVEMCQEIVDYWADAPISEDGARCVALSVTNAPPTQYVGIVELQDDGVWRVVEWLVDWIEE